MFCGFSTYAGYTAAKDDTISFDNRKYVIRENTLFTLDNRQLANCIWGTIGYNRLLFTPFKNLDSLSEITKAKEYMALYIEEYVSIAKKTGFLLSYQGCRECAYYITKKYSRNSSAYTITVSPNYFTEYLFFKDGSPKRIFVTDTVIRNSRNLLQATEIEYGSDNDTLSTRQVVLRYDSANYDLYWVVDGLVFKNEEVDKVKRKQLFEDGIIREEEIYFMGRFVQKINYPRVK